MTHAGSQSGVFLASTPVKVRFTFFTTLPSAPYQVSSSTTSPAAIPAAATITETDVGALVGALAHDSMAGRDSPSPELEQAAVYMADRFRALVTHYGVFDLVSMYGSTEELWFPEWEFYGTPWTNHEMYQKWSPHNYAAKFGEYKTPMLIVHGALDQLDPVYDR